MSSKARDLPAIRAVTLEAGTIFAERYEILAAAGRGGMGYVYRARHLGLAARGSRRIEPGSATWRE